MLLFQDFRAPQNRTWLPLARPEARAPGLRGLESNRLERCEKTRVEIENRSNLGGCTATGNTLGRQLQLTCYEYSRTGGRRAVRHLILVIFL